MLIIAAGAGHPIGFSAIALPQLRKENGTMRIDEEMGSWIGKLLLKLFFTHFMLKLAINVASPVLMSAHELMNARAFPRLRSNFFFL